MLKKIGAIAITVVATVALSVSAFAYSFEGDPTENTPDFDLPYIAERI
jgi:hypothetical protein